MSVRVLILGVGTVGKGVLKTILGKPEFSVCGIASSKGYIYSENGLGQEALKQMAAGKKMSDAADFKQGSAMELVKEKEYDVLIELTTTDIKNAEPAFSYMGEALVRGKHLVTSNKGPLALHFHELDSLAKKNECMMRFEATVGGAIPIFSTIRDYLADEKVGSVKGILNGTTNYILSRMFEERIPYATVLKEAQDRGIAEKDPSYDVEGIDAAAKLAIIGASVFGKKNAYSEVKRTGITHVTPEILELAAQRNYRIKLICSADSKGMEVSPRFVGLSDPLASISGTTNAVTIETGSAGPLTLVGRGAGQNETAAAVIADLVNIEKNTR
ncbi:homoserine dehydrogenase [Candidatus Micrarchaeota archaeon]|nr:homoserine dehydrogenase [Candidatus Micrarchaeota archaeon]